MDDRARNTQNHIKKRRKDMEAKITTPTVNGETPNKVAKAHQQEQMQSSVMKKSSIGAIIYSIMMHVALWILLLMSGAMLYIAPLLPDGSYGHTVDQHDPLSSGGKLITFLSESPLMTTLSLIVIVFYASCFLYFLIKLSDTKHQKNIKMEKILSKISFWIIPIIPCLLALFAFLTVGGWTLLFCYAIVQSFFVSIGGLFNFNDTLITYLGHWLLIITVLFNISTMMFFYKITNEKVNIRRKKIIGIVHLASLVLIILFSCLMCFAHS